MRDLYVDPVTGDLYRDPITRDITECPDAATECVQRVQRRVLTHLGEWMYDTSVGMDWRGLVQRKGVDLDVAAAAIRVVIERDPDVTRCRFVEIERGGSRTATVYWQADTVYGSVTDVAALVE